jgi:hypothetical protein
VSFRPGISIIFNAPRRLGAGSRAVFTMGRIVILLVLALAASAVGAPARPRPPAAPAASWADALDAAGAEDGGGVTVTGSARG